MEKIIVAAISQNYVLGKDDDLLWHLPADLKHYHDTVRNEWVMMGRTTFESNYEPVPYGQCIVVTRREDYQKEGLIAVQSIERAFEVAEQHGRDKLYILGGGEIYKQTIALSDKMILTVVKVEVEGDTHFPAIDDKLWKEVKRVQYQKDADNPHDYDFVFYERVV